MIYPARTMLPVRTGLLLLLAHASMAVAAAATSGASPGAVDAENVPRAPVSAFAELPAMRQPKLSPDGSRLLYLSPIDDTYHAAILDFSTRKVSLALAADPDQFLLNWCNWANDTRIVCSIRFYDELKASQVDARTHRYYRDGRTTFTRLVASDIDGSNQLQLIDPPVNRDRSDLEWNAVDQDNVISWLTADPEHILVSLNREDRSRPSVYRLNIYSNTLSRVRRYHDSVFAWYADSGGRLRFAAGYRDTTPVAFRIDERNRLQNLEIPVVDADLTPTVLGVSGDGTDVYLADYRDSNYRGVYRLGTSEDGRLTPLLQPTDYDFFGTLAEHPVSGRLLFAQYYTETLTRHWFDKQLQAELAPAIEKLAAVHRNVSIASFDHALNRFVLVGSGRGTAPTYYLYDHSDKNLIRLLATYPDIPLVVDPEVVGYPASDGYTITAYLTRPPGAGPFPTVILPHGGPNARDTASFSYWRQFLVNRGYAVLQPNFRGSVGYGAAHLRGGFEQWGLRMQEDVLNGLDWMIKEQIADPDRVCVVGGSYGGYVALVAAYKTPERIKCAVAFAGVTDLQHLKQHIGYYELGELTLARIQSGVAVDENSPIRNVADFGVPLLIVHGDLDRSVMVEQSRELVAALDAADKSYRYIEQSGGDHHLSRQSQRMEFFQALDEFLGSYLD